jgi:hypothetical protein
MGISTCPAFGRRHFGNDSLRKRDPQRAVCAYLIEMVLAEEALASFQNRSGRDWRLSIFETFGGLDSTFSRFLSRFRERSIGSHELSKHRRDELRWLYLLSCHAR